MALLKVHFIPKKKYNRRAYKAICGKQFVELTYKTNLVTCERCKKSSEYQAAQEDK